MRQFRGFVLGLILLTVTAGFALAKDATYRFNLNVREFELRNGMQFLIVERHATPQVACRIAIRAGSALEETGKTGIAHMLEHMMFKGTANFGSLDPRRDKELQDKIEAAYQIVLREERKRNPDTALIRVKRAEMKRLRLEVQKIYVPQAFSSQLGRNGAVGINAFTSKDQTQYTASVPSDMIEQWFSMISEQLFEPSWREFYVEKEVIQREWAFRYINSPEGAAWLDLNAAAYSAHPYRNPTIGWKSDMERFSTKAAVEFHRKYYVPSNAVCVLVGDVTLERARQLAEIYFERYPRGGEAPEEVTGEPPQQGPRESIRFLKGARTPLVRIGYHGARMGAPDFYALDALTMILSHGHGARMTQDIVNRGLAVEAWAFNPDNRYAGMIILGGSPNETRETKDENLDEGQKRRAYLKACRDLEEILIAEIDKLKTETVSKRELNRIKKINHRDFLEKLRSNEQLADTLASLEVQAGWPYLMTYLEEIDKVTPGDIMEVAKRYLRPENKTSVYVIPGGKPEQIPKRYAEIRSISGAAAAKAVRPVSFDNHSVYPTPQGWQHPLSFERSPVKIEYPEATIDKIGNTDVFYLPDRELPLVDLTILVKAGAVDIEPAKTGLTHIFNGCLVRGGTEKYPPQELALTLDEDAIRLSVSVGDEETLVHLSVMKDDWGKGLALLEEVLTRPRFDPQVLGVVKEQAVIALQRQGEDARTVSGREGLIWLFKGHPYGRDPLLGLRTIPKITREDLKDFLTTYFVPSNMVVAVAGDMDKGRVLVGLRKLFQAFPGKAAPARNLPPPPETPPVLAMIHKPGQVQAQIHLALRSYKRTHPDYWKTGLLMNIFGGGDSLLYKRLRDDLGLIYAAWFYQTFKWKAGMLVGYIGCKGDKTTDALEETVRIMKSLQEGIPEDEFEQKRLDALNSFVFNVDTPAALVDVYGHYRMRNEPLDTLERIQDAYISASSEELVNLAGRLLKPEKLQIFVVADKTTRVTGSSGSEMTLEEDLKALARRLELPYRQIPLR